MNIAQLAQEIETTYGVKICRDDKGAPIVSDCNTVTEIKCGAGFTSLKFVGYCEYNGGIRDFFDIYFNQKNGDDNSCRLTQQGFNIVDRYNQRAAVAVDTVKSAVLPTFTVETVERKITEEKVAPIAEPIEPIADGK